MVSQFHILNSFNDSIAVIDSKGFILFTNDAWKTFGSDNSGVLDRANEGINYLDVCNSAEGNDCLYATDAAKGILSVISGEHGFFEMEYPCHSPNEKRWFILRATPLKLEGFLNLILLSHINISDRKIAEELVEEKNKQLNEINLQLNNGLLKIVHDIVGPLNSIEGLINISKTEKNVQDIKHILFLLEKGVSNLQGFIRSTLKLTVSNSQIEKIEFKKILEEYFESIRYSEVLKVVELKFDVAEGAEFFNNKSEIISIISNLIGNSLKYYDAGKQKPAVNVRVRVTKEEAEIFISDNGTGVAQEHIGKIFDKNFQVNRNSNNGAGVGLYLVQKAVELLKGHLNFQSKIGEGTDVTVVIPNLNNQGN